MWKTLLPCARSEAVVVAHVRSDAPAHLTRIDPPMREAA
jgi:hypothetical protein